MHRKANRKSQTLSFLSNMSEKLPSMSIYVTKYAVNYSETTEILNKNDYSLDLKLLMFSKECGL